MPAIKKLPRGFDDIFFHSGYYFLNQNVGFFSEKAFLHTFINSVFGLIFERFLEHKL